MRSPIGTRLQNRALEVRELQPARLISHQQPRIRIPQHEGEPLHWSIDIQWKISAASLQNAQDCNYHPDRALQQNSDYSFAVDSFVSEHVCQGIRLQI